MQEFTVLHGIAYLLTVTCLPKFPYQGAHWLTEKEDATKAANTTSVSTHASTHNVPIPNSQKEVTMDFWADTFCKTGSEYLIW